LGKGGLLLSDRGFVNTEKRKKKRTIPKKVRGITVISYD